jgi:hypothetical protein
MEHRSNLTEKDYKAETTKGQASLYPALILGKEKEL